MKIPCRKCKAEMKYPYRICWKCGWEPKGKFLEKANIFAKRYEKIHGIDPEITGKEGTGPVPRMVKPVPGSGASGSTGKKRIKKTQKKKPVYEPEYLECPKCGEDVIIGSPERPVRLRCEKCGAKIKVVD